MIDDIRLPDTLSYSNEELNNIIKKEIAEWENAERKVCLEKIKELWNNKELKDKKNNLIECLICCEGLTNNNNLTLECGHKFHSLCLIQSIIIKDSIIFSKNIKDSHEKEVNDIVHGLITFI